MKLFYTYKILFVKYWVFEDTFNLYRYIDGLGQIQGKKAYGRPRTMLLDWLLKTEEGNISYEELKMSVQDRSRWSQWRCKPAIGQNTAERDRQTHNMMTKAEIKREYLSRCCWYIYIILGLFLIHFSLFNSCVSLWCSYYVSTCIWHVFLINWWWWWWWCGCLGCCCFA